MHQKVGHTDFRSQSRVDRGTASGPRLARKRLEPDLYALRPFGLCLLSKKYRSVRPPSSANIES
jgi:hypothetical protein